MNKELLKDIFIVIVSILVGIFLVKSQFLAHLLTSTQEWEIIGSFIAGMFFTSIFTTAPAIVALGEIAQVTPLLLVTFFGAVGAVIGDLIIFQFVKDRLSEHLIRLTHQHNIEGRISVFYKLKLFKWIPFLVGGLIIASPLPDELGISLLGIAKMKRSQFIVITFVFNFIGILLIGMVAQAL